MKLFIQLLCFLLCSQLHFAQDGFQFTTDKNKTCIPFKLINNLIIIPVKVNGVELNFLLDSGVEETILFSLDEKEEVRLFEVQHIVLKGLGGQDPIKGLRSSKNILTMPGLECQNHDILIVLDQEFNFSSSLGIPVNGIIGYHFFEKNLVEINYSKKRVCVYNEDKIAKRKIINGYKVFDIEIENSKPYIQASVMINDSPIKAKCLIDTGNSDPIWLFESKSDQISIPDKNFKDFLGRGFSGDIYGKRAKISKLSINEFEFKKPISSFPDSVSIKNVRMVEDRLGSVGGELLKRFNVVFDYKNSKLYLKKNKTYHDPFRYNISGINIHHVGVQWISEEIPLRTQLVSNSQENHYTQKETPDFKYNFLLKPVYEIASVREDSPAQKIGLLRGDIVVSINNKHTYKLSLQEIITLLKADSGGYIEIEIRRNGRTINFRFQLEELL